MESFNFFNLRAKIIKWTSASRRHCVFDSPLPEVPHYELPTIQQVGRYILFVKDNKSQKNKVVIPEVSGSSTEMLKKASIAVQLIKKFKIKLLQSVEEAYQSKE